VGNESKKEVSFSGGEGNEKIDQSAVINLKIVSHPF